MEGSATTPGGGQFGAEFRATGSGFQEQHGGQESPQQRQSLGHPFAPQIQEAPQKQVSTTKKGASILYLRWISIYVNF